VIATWETLTNGDQGAPIEMPGWNVRSVQILGTFDTSTLVIQGSNDGTNWATLNDLDGNALSFTAVGFAGVREISRYIRPACTAGGGSTDIDVKLLLIRRGN
jgi:hypothetical protein